MCAVWQKELPAYRERRCRHDTSCHTGIWFVFLHCAADVSVPQPGQKKFTAGKKDLLSYVDVDLAAYRLKYGQKMVKKNCTIPLWLNEKAEALGINFSKVLQDALVQKLDA